MLAIASCGKNIRADLLVMFSLRETSSALCSSPSTKNLSTTKDSGPFSASSSPVSEPSGCRWPFSSRSTRGRRRFESSTGSQRRSTIDRWRPSTRLEPTTLTLREESLEFWEVPSHFFLSVVPFLPSFCETGRSTSVDASLTSFLLHSQCFRGYDRLQERRVRLRLLGRAGTIIPTTTTAIFY